MSVDVLLHHREGQREGGGQQGALTPLPICLGKTLACACRMLEAAMLGIPYEGRMPDFAAQPARPDQQPTSPGAVAGRAVRQEQDHAYQQSLQVTIHNCTWPHGT